MTALKAFRVIPVLICGSLMLCTAAAAQEASGCGSTDTACQYFERLTREEQFDRIVQSVDKTKRYSAAARGLIGQAYLQLAGRDGTTPEQEEAFCLKAVSYGATQGYMGLYFINAQDNEQKALGYLREYVRTQPNDSVPYVILGETELLNGNYRLADAYLRQSKKVTRSHSARVDWLLFQANYLLGNHGEAGRLLESAVAGGAFQKELKSISTDSRFRGIEQMPAYRKYRGIFTEASVRP